LTYGLWIEKAAKSVFKSFLMLRAVLYSLYKFLERVSNQGHLESAKIDKMRSWLHSLLALLHTLWDTDSFLFNQFAITGRDFLEMSN
jgi:hypothetical protein